MVHELANPKRRVAGVKQVIRHAHQAELEKVFIAKDADEEIIGRLRSICDEHRIPCDVAHTMHQIGNACQIEVGSACAGVLRATHK
jgi:large subunit ribosomal protein L7A